MSLSTNETSTVAPPAESLPSRLSKYWRGGVATSVLVSGLLALPWLYVESNVYESSGLIEARVPTSGSGGELSAGTQLEAQVRSAIPTLEESASRGNRLAGPGSAIVKQLGEGRLLIVCRGDEPTSAQQLCANLVSRAMSAVGPARLIDGPKPPTAPLALPSDTTRDIWLRSSFTGLLSGLVWALLRARRSPPGPAPVRSVGLYTSIPPPGLQTSRESMRPRQTGVQTESVRPQAPARDVRIQADDVDLDWEYVPTLRAVGDLDAVCDQLCVAAASACLLVGVSSLLAERELKAHAAAHLAWRLSIAGQVRILLLEADFDAPGLGAALELDAPPRAGFSQQLLRHAQPEVDEPWVMLRCSDTLSVLLEGRVRTPGMLSTPTLRSVLQSFRRHFDIIVVAGPPAGQGVDNRAFARLIDAVVFVGSVGAGALQAEAQRQFATQRVVLPLQATL